MKLLTFLRQYVIHLIISALLILVGVFAGSYFVVGQYTERMVKFSDGIEQIPDTNRIGIVFGGGINGVNPTPLVRERLDTAKRLLDEDVVDKLLLSGDNRFLNYNEPTVMLNYLVDELGTDPELLQEDFAGRSTYETCERARKIFGLNQAVLISQNTHLPRALYLCEHFGIDSYGVISEGPASAGNANSQGIREILARTKAVFNANIIGEETILGEPIQL